MRRTIETVVTFLEMTDRPRIVGVPPARLRVALMQAEKPPVHFYRYLYKTVGRDYAWVDRLPLSDNALTDLIWNDRVSIYVAYAVGVPAGFFELCRSDDDAIWIAYFGLIPDFIDRGLGRWLIAEAVNAAWDGAPERLRVETCTLDHPRALQLYQRAGFVPYAQTQKTMTLPDGW